MTSVWDKYQGETVDRITIENSCLPRPSRKRSDIVVLRQREGTKQHGQKPVHLPSRNQVGLRGPSVRNYLVKTGVEDRVKEKTWWEHDTQGQGHRRYGRGFSRNVLLGEDLRIKERTNERESDVPHRRKT